MVRAFVTGGNRGLGLECVKVCLEHGCELVFLGCRNLQQGRVLACELASTYGERVEAVELDVTDAASIARAAAAVARSNAPNYAGHNEIEAKTVDVFVNNAGVLLENYQDGLRDEAARRTLAVNVYGAIDATKAFLPLLGPGAKVLNVSSSVGTRTHGLLTQSDRAALEAADLDEAELRRVAASFVAKFMDPGHAYCRMATPAYGASKCLLNAYTRLLARDRPDLFVNACSPGFCKTDICGPKGSMGGREPKSAALGATVFAAALFGDLGAGRTATFFKEGSKPGTPPSEATSTIEAWVAEPQPEAG